MKSCTQCKKTSVTAGRRSFLRSHYNPTTKVRKRPNLQRVTLPSGVRTHLCIKCLKTLHKVAAR